MIADDSTRSRALPRVWRVSRREFLAVAAAALAAGCAPTGSVVVRPTATPKPLEPVAPVAPETAARITRLATFSPDDDSIRGVAWSPDGLIVAAGGATRVHLWEVATGKKVGTWSGHQDQITGLAWSQTSRMLASASADSTVRLWNTAQGTQGVTTRILGGPDNGEVYSVAWSPDGKRVAAGMKGGQVILWDAATGKRLETWIGPALQGARGSHPYAVWGLAWSPDAKRIVSNRYDIKVLVWEAGSGQNVAVLVPNSQPNGVAWAPGGAAFATAGDDGSVQLWDAATYKNGATLDSHDGDGWAYGLTWTPSGDVLAATRQTGSVQVWNARTGALLASFPAHANAIWTAAWSPDGTRLATGSDDGTLALWGVR